MNGDQASDRFVRKRAFVRALYRGLEQLARRKRWGLLRAVEWLRAELGVSLSGWHALTNSTSRRRVPHLVLVRLEQVTADWKRPLRAGEWPA